MARTPTVRELEALSPYEPDSEVVAHRRKAELDRVVDGVLDRIVAKLREQSNRLREEEEKTYRRHRAELDRIKSGRASRS